MKECIFCKIIAGEIPAEKIYEDDVAIAFLDIRPINHGHALVVPKTHVKNIFDMPTELFCAVANPIKKVSNAVKEGTGADGINISMNNGSAAGQIIFHAHFHIIPRYEEDGLKHWGDRSYKDGEMKKMADKIKSFM